MELSMRLTEYSKAAKNELRKRLAKMSRRSQKLLIGRKEE